MPVCEVPTDLTESPDHHAARPAISSLDVKPSHGTTQVSTRCRITRSDTTLRGNILGYFSAHVNLMVTSKQASIPQNSPSRPETKRVQSFCGFEFTLLGVEGLYGSQESLTR